MKQNYSKFSNKFKNKENYEGIREPINPPVEEPKEEIIREPIEELTVENYIKSAVVIGCEKLNLREEPSKDAKVLCVLNKGEKVQVDMSAHTTPDFYKVVTSAGVEGYCMSKYISIE